MPRYRLWIEYDGTDFAGWQIQPQQTTVQGEIERALAICLRTPVGLVGSGRTDTGVHARGQVAHFSIDNAIDPRKIGNSLNGLLPPSIAIYRLERTTDDFHARYHACERRYHYAISTEARALTRHLRLHVRPTPDFDQMNCAAETLLGTQHFGAFCKIQSATTNRICTITRAIWVPEARAGDGRFEIHGDRFLHGMVRAIVGTLLEIGHGKRPIDALPAIIASQDRRQAGPAAPAHGLCLESVHYPTD